MLPIIVHTIYKDAVSNRDVSRDAFVSEWAVSSAWNENDSEAENTVDREYATALSGKLYDLAHMNATDLAKWAGISQRAFGKAFGIAQVTIEKWSSGQRQPTDWTKLLLAESIGFFAEKEVRP